jgi:hypothetical protein
MYFVYSRSRWRCLYYHFRLCVRLVREAWIRAKYEKKLFIDSGHPDDDPSISHMPEAGREGFMWKESGGSEGKFQKRWFILFGNRLSYYKEAGVCFVRSQLLFCFQI